MTTFPCAGLRIAAEDAAVFDVDGVDIVISPDSFVVSPLFFPGGDIGTLAVHGTINDVAMMGAAPLALAVAYVIEEGFPLADVAQAGPGIHAMRNPTRGGVASALNEIATASRVGIELDDAAVPVLPAVAAACELLGLDPLHLANGGCLVAITAPEAADPVLAAMRASPEGTGAVRLGRVVAEHPGRVLMQTLLGGRRVVEMLVGEQLPRIC